MRKLLMVILKLLGAISIIVDEGTDSEDLNAGAFLGLITALCAYAAVSEENLTEILYHNFKYGAWVKSKFGEAALTELMGIINDD